MERNETKSQFVADALKACPDLSLKSPEREALWFAIRDAVCTQGIAMVTPYGSSSLVEVTADHATSELVVHGHGKVPTGGQVRSPLVAR